MVDVAMIACSVSVPFLSHVVNQILVVLGVA